MSEPAATNKHWQNFILTESGSALRQRVIAGGTDGQKLSVEFTRAAIGQGRPAKDEDAYFLTKLVNHAENILIKESVASGKSHSMTIIIHNADFKEDLAVTNLTAIYPSTTVIAMVAVVVVVFVAVFKMGWGLLISVILYALGSQQKLQAQVPLMACILPPQVRHMERNMERLLLKTVVSTGIMRLLTPTV